MNRPTCRHILIVLAALLVLLPAAMVMGAMVPGSSGTGPDTRA